MAARSMTPHRDGMSRLPELFENNRRWAERMVRAQPDFFDRLVGQQAPRYMWIGCADSRVPANEIVGLLPGEMFGDEFGLSVGCAGDLNGDGYDDIRVGAPNNGSGGPYAGRLYVYFGGDPADTVPDLVFTGDADSRLGFDFVREPGDWNGDGLRDALYQHDRDSLGVRLGEVTGKGPGFGSKIAEQQSAVEAGVLRVADFDGDGLDDFVAYDPRDAQGRIYVFTNKGILPGTGVQLRAAEQAR